MASTFFLMKKMGEYHRLTGNLYKDWFQDFMDKQISTHFTAHCPLEGRHWVTGHNIGNEYRIYMITLFGNKVHYGIPIFLHEVQHFLVGHIPCARTSNARNCDAGLGILNPGTTSDNAGTISWNSRNDSILSMFVDDRQNIMIDAEEDENGNYKCRHKPLFPNPSRQESFASVTGPNTGFNTPLPKYPFSNLEDLDNYINPTYSCTKKRSRKSKIHFRLPP